MKTIKFKKLHKDAKLPERAHNTDAGFDVYAIDVKKVGSKTYVYDLGFALEIPPGGRVDIRPRSSIYKTGMLLCNSVGTIDEGYRGEIKCIFYHVDDMLKRYKVGDKIAQLLFSTREDVEFEEVEEFSNETDRGDGGFGSTGK